MLNSINLLGRLVKDPELRKTNSDVSFATFTIAVDNPVKEADGTRGTCFIDCRIFREAAENLVKYTRKGDRLVVSGAINQRNFVRQDGTKGKAYEILVDSVSYIEPKPEDEDPEEPNPEDLPDDDLPFKAEETKPQQKEKPAKYDPYTGKPLKPAKK